MFGSIGASNFQVLHLGGEAGGFHHFDGVAEGVGLPEDAERQRQVRAERDDRVAGEAEDQDERLVDAGPVEGDGPDEPGDAGEHGHPENASDGFVRSVTEFGGFAVLGVILRDHADEDEPGELEDGG